MSQIQKKRRAALTAAICLCVIMTAVVNASHGTLLSQIIAHYQLTDALQGYPNSAQNIGNIVAMLTSLLLIGRVSKQKLLLFAMALMAITFLPVGMLPGFPVFVGLFLVVGFAFGYIDTLTSSIMADLYPGKNSGRMMCLLHACHGSAGILAPFVLRFTLQKAGTGFTYIGICLFGVLLLCYLVPIFLQKENAAAPTTQHAQPVNADTFRRFFSNKVLVIAMLAILLYGFHLQGIICWVSRFVEVGLQSSLSAYVLSAMYLGLTASRLVMPLLGLSDLTYIRYSALVGGVLLGIGVLCGNALLAVICVALSAFVSGAMIPVIFAFACKLFAENTLLATTVSILFMLVGNTLSTPLIGAAEAVWGISYAMLLCAGTLLLCGGITFFVSKKEAAV